MERAISGHRQQEAEITEALALLNKESDALGQSCGKLQKKLGKEEKKKTEDEFVIDQETVNALLETLENGAGQPAVSQY